MPVREQKNCATKKGAHAVSVGGGATTTSQSSELVVCADAARQENPVSAEPRGKPMIWARKVALPKLHAWNGLVGRKPRKKWETGRGHDDALCAERGTTIPTLVLTCSTSTVDTYPRFRELNGLNKRCNGDMRYMKLSCSPDRPRTSFVGYERMNTMVARVLESRITRSGD